MKENGVLLNRTKKGNKMKKTIFIISVTIILCTVLFTSPAMALYRGVYYTHRGELYDDMADRPTAVCRTLGMVRNFYNSYEFSAECINGVASYNNSTFYNSKGVEAFCDGCNHVRNGELLPVPAEE